MYLKKCLTFTGQRLWFRSISFFFICTGDFSRVFQHYQASQVNNKQFLKQKKLNILQTSENDGFRTYASLVKSTEGSDIEYVNQIPDPDYVNACWVDCS